MWNLYNLHLHSVHRSNYLYWKSYSGIIFRLKAAAVTTTKKKQRKRNCSLYYFFFLNLIFIWLWLCIANVMAFRIKFNVSRFFTIFSFSSSFFPFTLPFIQIHLSRSVIYLVIYEQQIFLYFEWKWNVGSESVKKNKIFKI